MPVVFNMLLCNVYTSIFQSFFPIYQHLYVIAGQHIYFYDLEKKRGQNMIFDWRLKIAPNNLKSMWNMLMFSNVKSLGLNYMIDFFVDEIFFIILGYIINASLKSEMIHYVNCIETKLSNIKKKISRGKQILVSFFNVQDRNLFK